MVPSDLQDLERLNRSGYNWLPDSQSVRPSQHNLDLKHQALVDIHEKWHSFDDFILHTVFNIALDSSNVCQDTRLRVIDDFDITSEVRFAPNLFPYQVNGFHYVLWFGSNYSIVNKVSNDDNHHFDQEKPISHMHPRQPLSDIEITELIDKLLQEKYGKDKDYDFAW